MSARLYYSPDYFGTGAQTLYVDLDGAVRPARHWRLFGHVGALSPLGGEARFGGHRAYVDVRAGVAFAFRGCELRLAWTAIDPKPYYPSWYSPEEGRRLSCFGRMGSWTSAREVLEAGIAVQGEISLGPYLPA